MQWEVRLEWQPGGADAVRVSMVVSSDHGVPGGGEMVSQLGYCFIYISHRKGQVVTLKATVSFPKGKSCTLISFPVPRSEPVLGSREARFLRRDFMIPLSMVYMDSNNFLSPLPNGPRATYPSKIHQGYGTPRSFHQGP